jgi:hypothetical protein
MTICGATRLPSRPGEDSDRVSLLPDAREQIPPLSWATIGAQLQPLEQPLPRDTASMQSL